MTEQKKQPFRSKIEKLTPEKILKEISCPFCNGRIKKTMEGEYVCVECGSVFPVYEIYELYDFQTDIEL